MRPNAKYIRDPGCKKTFRSLDAVDATLGTPVKADDRGNVKFDPRNTQLCGLEIITNDRESPTYRQSMMAMSGVKVTTRYVP
ncbi:hypothetical protein ACH4OW_25475 [Streptomyces sp. NPDC017056]|uniref:hypothetical protein n=1 Tax=Streptomyces sp. NPDC017056 TaxID=3364973 RepID=UPI003792305E